MNSDNKDRPASGVVLVVDDEPGVRQVARRFLEEGSYQVLEAESGPAALKLLEEGAQVDFLMADLEMPAMRGEEMATRMRAARPDLKVLYVTGKIDTLFEKRPQLFEGEAFLDKPFTKQGLLEAVSVLRWGTLDGTLLPDSPPDPTPDFVSGSSLYVRWRRLLGRIRAKRHDT